MSERQTKANRANARRSTGPKTPEGKRAVRLNSIRHGLFAREVVLPGEDEGAFENLRSAMHTDLSPSGTVETFLVDRLVNTLWRLRRLERAETALLHWRVSELRMEHFGNKVRSYESTVEVGGYVLPLLAQFDTTIKDEAAHAAAGKAYTHAREERDGEAIFLGRAVDIDAASSDAFSKLSRYESTLERNFYRALHELQRLQAVRRGRPLEAPQAVDLEVTVSAQP